MLIVWYLCPVPNLVQISVTVTEIAHLYDFRLMTSCELMNIYLFQSGVIDIFPKFKMAAATILDFQVM